MPEVLEGGRFRAVADSRGGDDDAVDPNAYGPEPELPFGLADLGDLGGDLLRRRSHFHLAHQRLGPRGLAGEADAELFAHRAACAVTADEVARPQPFPMSEFDGHAFVVLLETGHRATAPDLCAQFDRVLFEQRSDDRLRDAQQIGVRGIQVLGRGFGDAGEVRAGRATPSAFENAIQQSAHCHQLETANVQADDADEQHGLGFLLQDEDPHIVQPQFGGQHRAGRPAPGDDHVEHGGWIVRRRLGGEPRRWHGCCLSGVRWWSRPDLSTRVIRTPNGLPARPPPLERHVCRDRLHRWSFRPGGGGNAGRQRLTAMQRPGAADPQRPWDVPLPQAAAVGQ